MTGTCPYCGTEDVKALQTHRKACKDKRQWERDYYKEHRDWPDRRSSPYLVRQGLGGGRRVIRKKVGRDGFNENRMER